MYLGIGRGVQNLVDYTSNVIIDTVQVEATQGSPNDTCKLTIYDRTSSFNIAPEDDLIITADPLTGVPSTNLLKNPGFDAWSGGFPTGWSIRGPYDPVGIPFQQDLRTGYTYDGQGSLYIPFNNNAYSDASRNPLSWIEFYQTITLPRDRSGNPLISNPYCFSVWAMYDAAASYNGYVYPQMLVYYLDQYGHVMNPQNASSSVYPWVDMVRPFNNGEEYAVVNPDTYTDIDGQPYVDGLDDHTWKRYCLFTKAPVGATKAVVAVSWAPDLLQDISFNPNYLHINNNISIYLDSYDSMPAAGQQYQPWASIAQAGQVWVDACQFEYCTYANKQGNYVPSNFNGTFVYNGTAANPQVPDSWAIGSSTTNTTQVPLLTTTYGTYNNNPNALLLDMSKLTSPVYDTNDSVGSAYNNVPSFVYDGGAQGYAGYQTAYAPSTAVNKTVGVASATDHSSQYGLFCYDRNQTYQITLTYKVLQNVTGNFQLFLGVQDFAQDYQGSMTNTSWQYTLKGPQNETASANWQTLTMTFGPHTSVPFYSQYFNQTVGGSVSPTPNPNFVMDTSTTYKSPERCLQLQFGIAHGSTIAGPYTGQYLIGDISIQAIGGFSTALTGGAYPTPYIGPGVNGAYYDGVAGLWFNQDRLFGGYVKTVNSKYAGGYERTLEISAVGYGVVLDEAPANILVQNMGDVAAIQKAVTYAQDAGYAVGIDDTTHMTSITTIDSAVFTWTTVKDVIDKVADYSVASWYVDYYRYLHFHPALADTFQYVLSANPDYSTSFPMSSWEYEQDGTQDLTSEVIEGSPQLSYPTTVSLTAASNYSQTVLNSNPRRYYRLGETVGATSIADSSPYAVNAPVNGGVTFGQTGVIVGDPNTAAAFNGSNAYAALPEYQLPNNNGNWSFELWFKANTTSGVQTLGAFGTWGATRGCAHIAINSGGLYAGSYNDDTNRTAVSAGTWYHAVATYDGGKRLRLYVNGQLAQEHIMQKSMIIAYNSIHSGATIGSDCDSNSIGNFFNGTLDEAAIYDHELSAQEVLDHYNASLGPVSVALNSGQGIVNLTTLTVNSSAVTWGIKGTDSANNFQFLLDYNNGTVYAGSSHFNVGDTIGATFQFYYPVLVRVSSSSAESPTGSIGRRIYQYTQATELTSLIAALSRAQSELSLRSQSQPLCKCTVVTPGPNQLGVHGLPTNPVLRPGQAINVYHPPSLGQNPQLFQVEKVTTKFAPNGVVIRELELGSYLPNIVMHIVFLRRRANRIVGTIGSTTSSVLADNQSLTDGWTVLDGVRAIAVTNPGHWNGPSTWTTGSFQWG